MTKRRVGDKAILKVFEPAADQKTGTAWKGGKPANGSTGGVNTEGEGEPRHFNIIFNNNIYNYNYNNNNGSSWNMPSKRKI